MRVIGKPRQFGAAQLARPINDVFDPEQEQQGCRLDQDHPEVRKPRQREQPHLRNQDASEGLAAGHAIGFAGFQLAPGDRAHRAKKNIGRERPKNDGKGQNCQEKPIDLVDPLRRGRQRQLGHRAHDKVVALTDWL